MGEKKNKSKVPPKMPGQSHEKFVYVSFSSCVVLARNFMLGRRKRQSLQPPSWGTVEFCHSSEVLKYGVGADGVGVKLPIFQ